MRRHAKEVTCIVGRSNFLDLQNNQEGLSAATDSGCVQAQDHRLGHPCMAHQLRGLTCSFAGEALICHSK